MHWRLAGKAGVREMLFFGISVHELSLCHGLCQKSSMDEASFLGYKVTGSGSYTNKQMKFDRMTSG